MLPLAPSRGLYLWPASPRLRTGVWVAVHYFDEPERTYRRYDPEFLYDKKNGYLAAYLGGAFRLGPFEVSAALPFVGLHAADFYEQGIVDREVRKVDRAPMRLAFKYGLRVQRRHHLWLLVPYLALSLPTGSREAYTLSLAGQPISHASAPPKSVGVMPGLATAWRYGWWSLSVSLGVAVSVPLHDHDSLEPGNVPLNVAADLIGVYQFGFTPLRDIGITMALVHRRTVTEPAEAQQDLVWLAPGIRLQPYSGLYGHLGVMFPVGKRIRARAPVMVTLQAGWEFR